MGVSPCGRKKKGERLERGPGRRMPGIAEDGEKEGPENYPPSQRGRVSERVEITRKEKKILNRRVREGAELPAQRRVGWVDLLRGRGEREKKLDPSF